MGGSYQHRGGLPPVGSPACTGVSSHRDCIRKLNDPASLQTLLASTLAEKRVKLQTLAAPALGRLTWQEAQDRLLTNDSFTRWLLPPLRDQTFGFNDRQLAELCLWREFFLRPKRQFSLETIGLLQLGYPALAKSTSVPAVAAQHGVTLEEWRTLVQVTLIFTFEAASPWPSHATCSDGSVILASPLSPSPLGR